MSKFAKNVFKHSQKLVFCLTLVLLRHARLERIRGSYNERQSAIDSEEDETNQSVSEQQHHQLIIENPDELITTEGHQHNKSEEKLLKSAFNFDEEKSVDKELITSDISPVYNQLGNLAFILY